MEIPRKIDKNCKSDPAPVSLKGCATEVTKKSGFVKPKYYKMYILGDILHNILGFISFPSECVPISKTARIPCLFQVYDLM